MSKGTVSRRNLFGMGIGAVATAGLAPLALTKPAYASGWEATTSVVQVDGFPGSIENAFSFQEMMMDVYATGDTVRLTQSYSDQSGLESTAFTYDNAVSIHAYLLDGSRDSVARA